MAGSDKRKQSLYFPEEMLKDIQDEAARQDRSLSWIVQKAWKLARKDIMKYPSVNEFPGEDDERGAAEEAKRLPPRHSEDRSIWPSLLHHGDWVGKRGSTRATTHAAADDRPPRVRDGSRRDP